MNVKLAAQVLSSTVSKALLKYGPPEAVRTAKFCSLMNIFFDIMNISDINSNNFELKLHLCHIQELMIHDFHGFEMCS